MALNTAMLPVSVCAHHEEYLQPVQRSSGGTRHWTRREKRATVNLYGDLLLLLPSASPVVVERHLTASLGHLT